MQLSIIFTPSTTMISSGGKVEDQSIYRFSGVSAYDVVYSTWLFFHEDDSVTSNHNRRV